ncbi:DUF4112 domain-containing protein [Aerosakkonema funiforme]|uniref:DUF4112 domain-containing protein n=1 Tax=Aerosakkonema funiforme FACHB-1375 TaxID=2949571 RepID=A0A926ZK83_9CYAN|nr:DUF4112 domain-containing protein [Aerosakkonema funiforme]MBD2185122.1 DUF4112 domain-containing protein [Aerosakkonema funiforme FACHB-1375]
MTYEPDSKAATLQRLRQISHLLDNAIAIPGTKYRVGLDPILGLLPGGGDTLTAFFSAYIVWEAARLGLPRESLVRMVMNILFDTVVGAVPIVGDFLDVTWKANVKNLQLVENHLASPIPSKKVDRVFLILLTVGLILFVGALTYVSVIIFRLLLMLFTGN